MLNGPPDERLGVGLEIVLEVDSVKEAYQRARGYPGAVASELKQRPWGLFDFRAVDPDGYYIRVTSR